MVTEEQVRENLQKVLVPGAMRSLMMLNMVRGVTVSDQRVSITLAATALSPGAQDWVRSKATEAVEKLSDGNKVDIEFLDINNKISTL